MFFVYILFPLQPCVGCYCMPFAWSARKERVNVFWIYFIPTSALCCTVLQRHWPLLHTFCRVSQVEKGSSCWGFPPPQPCVGQCGYLPCTGIVHYSMHFAWSARQEIVNVFWFFSPHFSLVTDIPAQASATTTCILPGQLVNVVGVFPTSALCWMVSSPFSHQHRRLPAPFFLFFGTLFNISTLKTLMLLVHAGLLWCFHNPPNSDMDCKVFNLHNYVIFLRGYTHAGLWLMVLFKELDVDLPFSVSQSPCQRRLCVGPYVTLNYFVLV